ncbi:MAG TPA: class II glutamine amidotransferase [Myxococcales bacterium]|nr:class II glutamine amidotransferase [Myxococcales bacterium]
MSSTLAILTSDPNLLRCQVELLKARRSPETGARPGAIGLAYVDADAVLLRKKPGAIEGLDLSGLVADVASEALFFHAGPLLSRVFADEDAMPLRFRRWMFIHAGALGSPAPSYGALWHELPDFLKRQVKGTTASELVFLSFVKKLRDEGRCDDFDIPPPLVGRLLAETVRRVEQLEREAGRVGNLSFLASNGRVMVATRLCSGRLDYALLEGIARCERCGITESTPDSHPLLRAHRRVRAVALGSGGPASDNSIEVPEGSLVTVGHNLEVQITPLA